MANIIYGVVQKYDYCDNVSAYAIDGNSNELVAKHVSSSESWAWNDLGFNKNNKNNKNTKYDALYPDGYELVWLGSNINDSRIRKFVETLNAVDEDDEEKQDDILTKPIYDISSSFKDDYVRVKYIDLYKDETYQLDLVRAGVTGSLLMNTESLTKFRDSITKLLNRNGTNSI